MTAPPLREDRRNLFIFFGFFAFFFYYLLEKGGVDQRLLENRRRAAQIMLSLFALLSFLLIFLLDRGVGADAVLLAGSLGYAHPSGGGAVQPLPEAGRGPLPGGVRAH